MTPEPVPQTSHFICRRAVTLRVRRYDSRRTTKDNPKNAPKYRGPKREAFAAAAQRPRVPWVAAKSSELATAAPVSTSAGR